MPARGFNPEFPHEPLTALFDALATACCDVRLRILILLARGPCDVSQIARMLDKSDSQISRHLSAMARADFVDYTQNGRYHTFFLHTRARVNLRASPPTIELEGEDGSSLVVRLGPSLLEILRVESASLPELKPVTAGTSPITPTTPTTAAHAPFNAAAVPGNRDGARLSNHHPTGP